MKKKILETFMFLCQYDYYVMREADKRSDFPVWFTKYRALVVLGITETLMLATVNLLIYRIIYGQTFPKLPSLPFPVIAAFTYGLVVYYINKRIIGPDSRIHHYKEIFDSWDKWKRLRWKVLTISIEVASLAAFFLVGEVSQNGLDPQNWKW
jgi:hypothetical protein